MRLQSELRQLVAFADGVRVFAASKGNSVDRIDALLCSALEASTKSMARAQGYFHLAVLISRRLHLYSHLGRALNHLAWTALAANQLEAVLMLSNEALLAGQAAQSWKVQAGARYMLANLRSQVGDYVRAEADLLSLVRLAEVNNDTIRGADYRYVLARVRAEKSQYRAAISLATAVYEDYVAAADPQVIRVLNDIATWYTQLEEFDEALAFTQRALGQCPAINLALRATLTQTIADIQLKKGNVAEAKRQNDLCQRISTGIDIGFDFSAYARLITAEIKLADGDKATALTMLSELIGERDNQSYNFANGVRKSYVKALRLDGQTEKANQVERESNAVKRDFFRKQSDQRYQLNSLQDKVNEMIATWHQREAAFISSAG
jgi:tetratricopeptide (TPR) repeat protein